VLGNKIILNLSAPLTYRLPQSIHIYKWINYFAFYTSEGYAIFHKEVNVIPVANLKCTEFGLAKLDIDCSTEDMKYEVAWAR
jgi:hypothetical protein